MTSPSIRRWQHAEKLWAAREAEDARREYDALLSDPDWMLPANLRLGAIAQETGQVRAAVSHALAAFYARDPDPMLLEALCRMLLNVGETRSALHCADDPAVAACTEPAVLAGFGKLMAAHGFAERAATLLRRARALGMDTAELHFLIGQVEARARNTAAAEAGYEACLAAAPNHAGAHAALAALRSATPERNHVPRLREVLARHPETHADTAKLQFALFKELDDLGDTDAAWTALAEGMRLRRRKRRHDAADDAAIFETLMRLRATSPPPVEPGPAPVFIVGLPRSGAGVLERLLANDPRLVATGAPGDAVMQLRWCAQRIGGPAVDSELVKACAGADLSQLARRYLAHVQWRATGKPFFIDRSPGLSLCLGYLANALPQARFLHVVRDPMDVCFANLQHLFDQGGTHSYDQAEMAAHFLRHQALMAHWHRQFPGRVLDVAYEALVTDPHGSVRRVFEHCGLDYVPTPGRAPDPRLVGQWRRYAGHLQPLREALGVEG